MREEKGARSHHSTDYLQAVDSVDAQILRELSTSDPRNISLLAREVKKPIETVRYRYNRMARTLGLKLTSYVVYSKLGLKRLSVFCFIPPKNVKKAGQALESLDFWTYLTKFYGITDGYYGVYALPAEESDFLAKYVATLSQSGLLRHHTVYATGDPQVVAANFKGFDFENHTWRFEWEKWLGQLERAPAQAPPGLSDPPGFTISADRVCLRVLEMIEEQSSTSFVEIAEKVDLTPQDIRYHYFRHIMGRGIISGFRPQILPFPASVAGTYTLFLRFHDEGVMVNFADWLSSTFIAMSYAKVIGENSLIVHSYLPRVEENRLHEFLFQMSETGYLDDYYYVSIDMGSYKAWSIRPEKFNRGLWSLNQEEYLQRLHEILEPSRLPAKPEVAAQLTKTSNPQR